jgi:tRNA threonylcarbamoyladenosine biosynthesis protein TsaE
MGRDSAKTMAMPQPMMIPSGTLPVARLVVDLPDEAATAALAARLAEHLAPGDVVALSGDLGVGKTTLVRAVIHAALDAETEVPSPTFTLVQTYDLPAGPLWHFDLYRLSSPDEVIELGWEEARTDGIVMVEWPDRLGRLLPAERLDLELGFGTNPTARSAVLTGYGAWAARSAALR